MKFKNKRNERIYTVLFMVLVTIIFITFTSGVYLFTRDKININKTLYIKRAVLYAADIKVPKDSASVEDVYAKRIVEVKDKEGRLKYMKVMDNTGSKLQGYAVIVNGPGLWGEIEAVLGFNTSLKKITGIDFIKQNETPGLGARISESWFKEQFRGREGPFKLVPEGTSTGGQNIDAITGASITSTSVLNIINRTVSEVKEKIGG